MKKIKILFILAGIILVTFFIIFIGKIIYENGYIGKNVKTSMEEWENPVTIHNSDFEGYFGKYVSGNNVRDLFLRVQASNKSAQINNESNIITIYSGIYENEKITVNSNKQLSISDIDNSKTYMVDVSITGNEDKDYSDAEFGEEATSAYWSNGFIKTIVVIENNVVQIPDEE